MKFFLIILFLIIITNCSLVQKTQEINTETVSSPHYLSMTCESLAVEHNSVLRDFENTPQIKVQDCLQQKLQLFL